MVTVRPMAAPMLRASWSLIRPVGGKTSRSAMDATAPIRTRRAMRQNVLPFFGAAGVPETVAMRVSTQHD